MTEKEKPTLKDVAREAGVSYTTASLVLSGKGKISERVRDKVFATATQLGYKKKLRLPAEKGKRSNYIAILHYVPWDYSWNFIRPFIIELEKVFYKRDYFPLFLNMNQQLSSEDVLHKIINSGIHGVCSIHYSDEGLFERLEKSEIPVVIINNSNVQNKFDLVCVDDFQGAYEGTLHLIELGHRHIVYADYHRPDFPAVFADRFIGFKKAIDEYQLPFEKGQRITTDLYGLKELKTKLRAWFTKTNKPTAIFVHDDYFAARVMTVLRTLSLRVPQDVSILAPGDTLSYQEPFIPQITTMKINTSLMGKLAGDLMMNRLTKKPEDIHVLKVKQQLIKRGSCRRL